MLFPFAPPRAATFWMGKVAFPIDVVFVNQARVARVVHGALPGTRERWSHPVTQAVVELAGGTCSRYGIRLGTDVRIAGGSYNLMRTIVEARPGYDGQEPLAPPGHAHLPRDDRGLERFQERQLVDEADPNAQDQPNPHWHEQLSPLSFHSPALRWSPVEAQRRGIHGGGSDDGDGDGDGDGGGASGVLLGGGDAGAVRDPGTFVAGLVEALAREGLVGRALSWKPDKLNGGATESAVVTGREATSWLAALNLTPEAHAAAANVLETPQGLELLADGLVLAELADVGRIVGQAVVLFRGGHSGSIR